MSSAEPLINPYLWAVGKAALTLPPQTEVAGRYRVISPQVWLDTQPATPLAVPDEMPQELLPYHYLYPLRLHVPVVYGLCPTEAGTVVLLENVPLEGAGRLLPSLGEGLATATPLRQVYWLWQLLQLWDPLDRLGVAASLLVPDNLRVEGGLVRLRELYAGLGGDWPLGSGLDLLEPRYQDSLDRPDFAELGHLWLRWMPQIHPEVRESLIHLAQQIQDQGATIATIAPDLNDLLLGLTTDLPLQIQTLGLTDTGPSHSHNEDACYPLPRDLQNAKLPPDSQLIPHVALVCDGIGGHEGGEVASQLAVRSIKLQVQALLQEIAQQEQAMAPDLLMDQLAASVRVVNNLISVQNDVQGREHRQRMATTLVLAVHLQQPLAQGDGTSHELYLVSVGDSRAYWITPRYCQRLTVDDDVACREVRMGRSFYRQALQRPDAGSLTQALGARHGEELYLQVQRFILDEDGLLLLCSDGLSDYGWVERTWGSSITPVLSGVQNLEQAAHDWLDLANDRNGHDNTSVVLLRCRVSPAYDLPIDSKPPQTESKPVAPLAARPSVNLELESSSATALARPALNAPKPKGPWRAVGFTLLGLGVAGLLGLIIVRQLTYFQNQPQPADSDPTPEAIESTPESSPPE
ncbi:MAG: PP2C family protein-serine/threonine phosphatase [Prochlorothrix sp.]